MGRLPLNTWSGVSALLLKKNHIFYHPTGGRTSGGDSRDQLCQSGFATLPSELLQEQPAVVRLWGRPLASWFLALGERGGHDDLRGLGHLSVIPYVQGRTELYWAQACLA
jgi:hypothetical protein